MKKKTAFLAELGNPAIDALLRTHRTVNVPVGAMAG